MSINIAVTGSFCSGKTSLCRYFNQHGFRVFNTDDMVHNILSSREMKKKIRHAFGNEAFSGQKIDRKKLAGLIFENKKSWSLINHLIHPEVIKKVRRILGSKAYGPKRVFEVPLLFEAGMENMFDGVLYIDAPEKIREKRAQARGFAKQEIKKRSAFLLNEKNKKAQSDFVIINKGSEKELQKKIEKIITKTKE